MRSNEELAIMIQDGDKSIIPELWERVRGIYMQKAFRYYGTHKPLCDRCGVTVDDIQQQAFFAFLRSIEQYEPECELAFTSYINYPFMTEMQELTRTRHSGQLADCLNRCSSLDKPIETDDGTADTIGDFVPDPDALYFVELLDAESVAAMIRNEVQQLPERECAVIAGLFFDGQTLGRIADALGLTFQRVSQLKKRGLVMLSQRRALVDLWNEMHHTENLRQLARAAHSDRPDTMPNESAKILARQTAFMNRDTPLARAFRYAAELRAAAESSGEEWTNEKQTAAVVEYLTQQPVNA